MIGAEGEVQQRLGGSVVPRDAALTEWHPHMARSGRSYSRGRATDATREASVELSDTDSAPTGVSLRRVRVRAVATCGVVYLLVLLVVVNVVLVVAAR